MKTAGRLWYVVGPSGAGKDSVIGYARAHCPTGLPLVFAHRYITRPADAGGENHVALSEAEFHWRAERGLFALAWTRNGLHYGIGREVQDWLADGIDVVVNGSRHSLETARTVFPGIRPVWVTAPPVLLAERLARRGREDAAAIAARLAMAPCTIPDDAKVICNEGPLELAGQCLLDWLG